MGPRGHHELVYTCHIRPWRFQRVAGALGGVVTLNEEHEMFTAILEVELH